MVLRILFLFGSSLAALPAYAQQVAPEVEVEAETDEEAVADVVVTGARERGSVPGDIAPEVQLRPGDIRTYGVASVAELLTELEPQTRSARGREGGRQVVLLNGRRISGFGEIRDLPTEAIERVDILPEEAALRLGYRADQRVVNIVLRRRFNAITGEVQAGGATAGGRPTGAADANLLRIGRDRRLSVNLHYDAAGALDEADRDIVPTLPSRLFSIVGTISPAGGAAEIDPALSALAGRTVTAAGVPVGVAGRPALSAFLTPGAADSVAAFRTIAVATQKASANATYSRMVLGDVTAALNGSFEVTSADSRLGLGSASIVLPAASPFSPFASAVTIDRYLLEAGPRRRRVDGNVGHLGLALNGDVGDWRWSVTSNYDRSYSRTLTDTSVDLAPVAARIAAGDPALNPFARFDPGLLGGFRQDSARSVTDTLNAETVVSGPVLAVPAGRIATTFKAGIESSSFDARAIRSGVASAGSLARDAGSLQVSVDVPIASRRTGFLSAIGNLSLNGNYAIDRLSDFGTLTTLGYGLNWSPITAVRLLASVTREEGPPSVAQLGNPIIVTPDVRVFDFVTGQSVDITRVDGGNPGLLADDRRVMKLGLNVRPFASADVTLTADYVATRTRNLIAGLPAPTAEIETAFPDRFTRDAGGRLLRLDNRPVNFARRDQQELRWGINLSQRIGPAPQRPEGGFGRRFQRSDGAPAATPGERQGGFGGRGGGGFGRGGFGGTRLQFSAYHTWHLQEQILIRPGVPVLDLLDGAATGSRGGQSEHEVSVDAGLARNWLGLRLSGRWQSGSFVRGGTARAPTDLDFAPLTTVTLRAFANLTPNLKIVRDHPWLRGTRVTLSVQNLFDAKLRVTDPTGSVPLNYQPDLLDPTGRTIRIGIRKLFF